MAARLNTLGRSGATLDGNYQTMTSFGSEADMLALALRSDGVGMVGGQGHPEWTSDVGLFDGLALLDLAYDGLERSLVPS